MLDKVIYDFRDCDIKLVRIGARKNFIEVWRKVWDRERPKKAPKKFQDIGIAPMKKEAVLKFVHSLIGACLRP